MLRVTDSFAEVARRTNPKVPTLRGRTVATLFFEESTRTRMSFETAAKRMSADVLSFSAASSSLQKKESLRDTVETDRGDRDRLGDHPAPLLRRARAGGRAGSSTAR